MPNPLRRSTFAGQAALLLAFALACGCTTLSDYIHNGFKVGPNYGRPPAPVAHDWIDAADQRVRKVDDDLCQWWTTFKDPVLDNLIAFAYKQNLSLREVGFRVLEARAQLCIAVGYLLPQTQQATGDFTHTGLTTATANNFLNFGIPGVKRFYNQWDSGFNLSWEIDFWGRFRRAVESNAATLNASVENYDDVLVTLLGDVATNYVQLRTTEERIKIAKENVELQRETLRIVAARFKAGTVSELDVDQAGSTLAQTEAQVPELEILLRQYNNQLCILLGIPPEELKAKIGTAPIPTAPADVAVGIPADLLRRRPDVRRAERQAAAQSAQIGIADADFYPHIIVNGNIGCSAEDLGDLFRVTTAYQGSIAPSFQWNILSYGRILNNVRFQDAKFQELVAAYQNTVLNANKDVENGLVTFLRAQLRKRFQADAVDKAEKAVKIGLKQYAAGTVDLTRVTQLEQSQVVQQETLALAQGEIALGLIQVFRRLGGGWQIRLADCAPNGQPPAHGEATPKQSPVPSASLPSALFPVVYRPETAPGDGPFPPVVDTRSIPSPGDEPTVSGTLLPPIGSVSLPPKSLQSLPAKKRPEVPD